jgi:hypothetical protein
VEYRLCDGDVPEVSTFAFHEHRPRARHLEQDAHRPRLDKAADMVREAVAELRTGEHSLVTVSDLGCGDGGLLSLLSEIAGVQAWGYDFQPSNAVGWLERRVTAEFADVFGTDRDLVDYGEVVVLTEVLEHLADPHGVIRRIGQQPQVRYLVASSPWTEHTDSHDACHAWAWDLDGYRALVEQGGFKVLRHDKVGMFQVVLAVTR